MQSDISNNHIQASFQLKHPEAHDNSFILDIDLTLPSQGVTVIFGPSGSGKTTLLRCIAGLEEPDKGQLSINGEIWQNASLSMPTHKRPLGYVFQESSLFPHLTALGNLNYARKRAGKKVSNQLYDHAIDIMGIHDILHRYPQQLSGGERQRVAIARALLINPLLLLMDEPLASLDKQRKQEIIPYLERLGSSLEIPIIYVSHSMDEVSRLADHVVVLKQGKVSAQGGLTEVFSQIDLPLDYGDDTGVVLQGHVIERDRKWHLARIAFSDGELWVRDRGDELNQAVRVRVLARDVSLTLTPDNDSSILNRLAVTVDEIAADTDEAMALIRLKTGSEYLIARLTCKSIDRLQLEPGKKLWTQIKSVALIS
ncbi:molybdenum ABC transporter ATP-binding protein [Neptuniibacter marinus]|uniref:molybdenum ABC transporter ATP-binding protein n=1 Tax=Neptuniibacter marinus TaxID=1806670 RepID=UPI003B5BAE72